MQALLIIINIVLILIAIVLIVSVLMQEGNRQGLGAIAGGAETFLGKSKAKGVEAKLELITKIAAGVFIVLAIVATVLTARMGADTSVEVPVAPMEESIDGQIAEEPDAEKDVVDDLEKEAEKAAEAPAAEPAAEAPTAAPAAEAPAAEAPAAEPAA